jgi:hypothetical protein
VPEPSSQIIVRARLHALGADRACSEPCATARHRTRLSRPDGSWAGRSAGPLPGVGDIPDHRASRMRAGRWVRPARGPGGRPPGRVGLSWLWHIATRSPVYLTSTRLFRIAINAALHERARVLNIRSCGSAFGRSTRSTSTSPTSTRAMTISRRLEAKRRRGGGTVYKLLRTL